MMINVGKSQVFKRKMPQTLDRIVGREPPLANLLE